MFSKIFIAILMAKSFCIYQDLSYGEILTGRPGAWLVKIICYMHTIIKFKHVLEIILNFNITSLFNFFDCMHIKNNFFTSQAPGRPAKISP